MTFWSLHSLSPQLTLPFFSLTLQQNSFQSLSPQTASFLVPVSDMQNIFHFLMLLPVFTIFDILMLNYQLISEPSKTKQHSMRSHESPAHHE